MNNKFYLSLMVLLCLFSVPGMAQQDLELDVLCALKEELVLNAEDAHLKQKSFAILQDRKGEVKFFDHGLCTDLKSSLAVELKEKKKKGVLDAEWRIRLYASHAFTHYFNSDVTFQSTRFNMEIKDYQWMERGSREFFNPKTWAEEGNNPAQILDEPTNTFTLSFEKGNNSIYISAFHPKFLQKTDQMAHIIGNIDGVDVDHVDYVNTPFHGYEFTPGELKLVRNQNTHLQMEYTIGVAHRFDLAKTKIGNFSLQPSVAVGMMMGRNYSVAVKEGEWWEFEDGDDGLKVQGFGYNLGMKAMWTTPNQRFGVFGEARYGSYYQKHGFMDGSQKYQLQYVQANVGMSFNIYSRPKPKPKPLATPNPFGL